jgi:hypothetical protein
MDSPVYARNAKRLSAESPAASICSTLTRREKQCTIPLSGSRQTPGTSPYTVEVEWKVEKFDIGDFIPPFGY